MLADGDHARYHFIDAGGEVVALVLEASADVDLDELAALAQSVIESMVLEELPRQLDRPTSSAVSEARRARGEPPL